MDQFDLLTIGDASLDVFTTPDESEALCTLDDKKCLVCFSYGDKIPVKNLEFSIGGNAANNAVGVRRLGVSVSIVLSLGDDDIGSQIKEHLKKENVDITFVVQKPGTRTNYSTIITYGGERTIFVYHAPRIYEFPSELPTAPWMYLTSMGAGFEPFYNKTLDWLAKNSETKLAFNPGSYQLRADPKIMKSVLERTYVVFVNRQEAEKITGTLESSQGKERELLKALSAMGPKVSVVTDGGNGSFIYDGKRFVKAEVLPIDAYERTGAGDAFGSGCLAALIKGKSLEDALLWGTLNSASKIGFVGSQRGLLREEEIPVWVDRAKSSRVNVEEF